MSGFSISLDFGWKDCVFNRKGMKKESIEIEYKSLTKRGPTGTEKVNTYVGSTISSYMK